MGHGADVPQPFALRAYNSAHGIPHPSQLVPSDQRGALLTPALWARTNLKIGSQWSASAAHEGGPQRMPQATLTIPRITWRERREVNHVVYPHALPLQTPP